MMSDLDHERFAVLLDQADVLASSEAMDGAVMVALKSYGFDFEHHSYATSFNRTDYRVDHFLRLRAPQQDAPVSATLRTLGLPEGQLVIYLVMSVCKGGLLDPLEECQHLMLFRSEPVSDWRVARDPVAALREGIIRAGFLEAIDWSTVAEQAALQVDRFFQR